MLKRLVLFSLGLFFLASVYIIWSNRENLINGIETIGFASLLLPISLSLFGLIARYVRFRSVLFSFGYAVSFAKGLRYYLAGIAFGLTPGRAGEAIRCLWMEWLGVPKGVTVFATAIERIFDLLALGSFALAGLLVYRQDNNISFLSVAFFLILLTAVFGSKRLIQFFVDRFPISRFEKSKPFIRKLWGFIYTQIRLLHEFKSTPLTILYQLFLSALIWGIGGVIAFWFSVRLGYSNISPLLITSLYALSLFVGTLSMLPGGIGGVEASMVALYTACGISFADAILIVSLTRGTLFWLPLLLGAALIPRKNSESRDLKQ